MPRLLLGLICLSTLAGWLYIALGPGAKNFGYFWPVGVLTGVLLIGATRRAPVILSLFVLSGFITYATNGFPLVVAAGFAVALASEALVTKSVLRHRRTRRMELTNDGDLGRYLIGCFAGAGVAAIGYAATVGLTGFGNWHPTLIAVLINHAACQVGLVAYFMPSARPMPRQDNRERIIRWTTVVVLIVTISVVNLPALAFLLLPLVGWAALRASMTEALIQVTLIAVVIQGLAAARLGPFSHAPFTELPPELQRLGLALFILGCSLVCLPFSMAVTREQVSGITSKVQGERLNSLLQSLNTTAIMEFDRSGRFTMVNTAFETMFGYTFADIAGKPAAVVLSPAEATAHVWAPDAQTFQEAAEQQALEGKPRDWRFRTKSGIDWVASVSLAPIRDARDKITGYVASAEDVTERVRGEEILKAALETERLANSRLQEVDQVKDDFVSTVSHELRTPITNIVGYLELIEDGMYGEPSQGQRDALRRIHGNSERLLSLINDLLTMSNTPALGLKRGSRTPVDLQKTMTMAEAMVQPWLAERALDIRWEHPSSKVLIQGDEPMLGVILTNLVTNAMKFTADGGRITVRCGNSKHGAFLEVEDTGIGISEEDIPRLFERFYKSDEARRLATQGSGLGLPIVETLASQHGAKVEVYSTPGVGSRFRVCFPPAISNAMPLPEQPGIDAPNAQLPA